MGSWALSNRDPGGIILPAGRRLPLVVPLPNCISHHGVFTLKLKKKNLKYYRTMFEPLNGMSYVLRKLQARLVMTWTVVSTFIRSNQQALGNHIKK